MKYRHGPATVMDRAFTNTTVPWAWEGVRLVIPKSGDLPIVTMLFITHEDEEVLFIRRT